MIRLSTTGYLIAALAVSVPLNLYQLHRAGIKSTEADHAVEMQRAEAAIAGLENTIKLNELLAGQRIADHATLLGTLEAIAERGQKTRTVWRQAEAAPLADGCGPGQARIDAVNAHLGPVR